MHLHFAFLGQHPVGKFLAQGGGSGFEIEIWERAKIGLGDLKPFSLIVSPPLQALEKCLTAPWGGPLAIIGASVPSPQDSQSSLELLGLDMIRKHHCLVVDNRSKLYTSQDWPFLDFK